MFSRGPFVTLAVLLLTAWLVVYEGPERRSINGWLGPLLLAGAIACGLWAAVVPLARRAYLRAHAIGKVEVVYDDLPDGEWARIIVHGLRSVFQFGAVLEDPNGIVTDLPLSAHHGRESADLNLPASFNPLPQRLEGPYLLTWQVRRTVNDGVVEAGRKRLRLVRPTRGSRAKRLKNKLHVYFTQVRGR